MRVFRHFDSLPDDARGAVLAIGNFDGVHRGHEVVIRAAAERARATGAKLGVVTFEPHPRQFFQPALPPFRLTPFRAKMHALAALGCDLAVALQFDARLAAEPAERFVETVLVKGLGLSQAVIGYDFVFGKGRRGDGALLAELGLRHGFAVAVIEAASLGGVIVSSTEIRHRLVAGDMRAAAELLGRPWEIEARVLRGDQRGRTIGFPTANLALGPYLRPATGVYAVRNGITDADGRVDWIAGVANLGTRPTVNGTDLRLESHLFDWTGDLYGRELRVQLVERLREERRFDGLDALKAQIARDADAARAVLGAARPA